MDSKLLDGVVIFYQVIKSGSFTATADITGHSTSYISKEINKLESRLGIRLMNRTTRSISLTPEGELFYQQASQIVQEADQIISQIRGNQTEPQGLLKVSCPVSFGLSRVRPILAEFTETYPKVSLDLQLNDRKVDLIADGFDVAIRASAQLEDSSLISRKVMSSEGLVIASPSYLTKWRTPKQPSELVNHQCISYSYLKQPNNWTFIDQENNEFTVRVNSRVITNSPEMELELCKAGQGITRLPKFNLQDELETGQLVTLFNDFKRVPIDVYLVYPSRKHLSAKVRVFIDFILKHLSEN